MRVQGWDVRGRGELRFRRFSGKFVRYSGNLRIERQTFTVRFVCCENVSFGSGVIPRILGVFRLV